MAPARQAERLAPAWDIGWRLLAVAALLAITWALVRPRRDPRFAEQYALWHLPLDGQSFAQLFVRRELLQRLGGG